MAAEDYIDFEDYWEDSRDSYLRTQKRPNMYKPIPHLPFHGEPWTAAQEKRLEDLWRKRHSLDSLSQYMGRTKVAIIARLEKLGFDPEYAYETTPVKKTTATKKEPMMQNFQHLIALLQKNYTTVAVNFMNPDDGSARSGEYTYKVPLSLAKELAKGDLLVVPARGSFAVVKVAEVHETPQIDVKQPLALKWIVQKVDRTAYDDQTAREAEAVKQVEVAERRRAQEEALQTLLGSAEDREAFLALINAK